MNKNLYIPISGKHKAPISNQNLSVDKEQIASFIKLFKLLPIHHMNQGFISFENVANLGLLFVGADGQFKTRVGSIGFEYASSFYGSQTRLFNETFYKSFSTVRDAAPMQLLFDQLTHYMSTYSAEAIGLKIPTYVPVQALNIPKTSFKKDFKFTVIREASINECIERLDSYLKTMTAPSEEIKQFISPILPFTTVKTDDIKSFEIQIMKHKMDGTVPEAPVNQLRYLVYMTTGETLLIKNKFLRTRIQTAESGNIAYEILSQCNAAGLASIFLRYKSIFLAYKKHPHCAPIINHLRRLAEKYHKPLNEESLQNFSSLTSDAARKRVLSKANNRELIKLLDSMYARLNIDGSVPGVYSVRNGRIFVKDCGMVPAKEETYNIADSVLGLLLERLRPTLSGKIYYLPEYIEYVVPTTEKQFIGNIPYGSSVSVVPDAAFTVGVHWFNQEGRTDIDLHLNSATRHFGWNSMYRDGVEILYTGDQTDAPLPRGGAEAYWFKPQSDVYVLSANLYSGAKNTDFKLFMTEVKPSPACQQNRDYTYDPSESLFPAIPMKFNAEARDMNIGVFCENSFYFYGGQLSSGIVPQANYEKFIEGFVAQITAKCNLRNLLELAGANVLTSIDDLDEKELTNVISLAPEDLTVDTLFNIIDGK